MAVFAGETSLFEHDAVGNPERVTYGNALQTDISRDLLDRVTRQDIVNAAPQVAFDYTLDPTGRRLSMTDADGRTADYEYDDTYKLTREDVAGDPADDGALVYTYDPVGNRMELFSTLTPLSGAAYTYDLNDRLDADTYDANGNTLSSSGNTFAYDFEDRLLDYNTGEVVNVYDADGNRVLRTRGASTTAYLMDELNPTGFAQVVEEITDGVVTATYALGTWRTHQVRWKSGTPAPSYYAYDAHGNVRALLDANRSVTDRYEYDAFGNLLSTSGTTFNSYFYTGEQFDPTMGLYNLRARWYSPGVGRFATEDPFEGFAPLPFSLHSYLYANADPINNFDPSGQATIVGTAIRASFITIRIASTSLARVRTFQVPAGVRAVPWSPQSRPQRAGRWISSMSEIPVHSRPRRLVDWINPTGARKVHSLIDKVYKRKNLEMAWEMVQANRGSGGVDGQSLEGFAAQLNQQLDRLQSELKEDVYRPQPVRQVQIPKAGKPGEFRTLGIPTIYDRVCQQALLNRLEPIFEPVFDDANFGYRRGRSTKDAMRKVWKEMQSGREWIVDADLKDFFGSVDHRKLLTLVAQRVADGRVLRLIEAMLKAGSYGEGRLFPTERGTPQGGVVSPLLSNILLTPFDREMRRKGYQLTRYADDWVVTCESAAEARAAVAAALRILSELGVQLHPQKTRIVHVRQGFEFLGYKIKRGKRLRLPPGKIRSGAQAGALYAYPREKSIRRFMDQVRVLSKRRVPLKTEQLIEELNPVLRGWGQHYKRAHVRKLFHRLDGWIVRRIRSHRCRRWRNGGWRQLPETKLYGEYGLVNLVQLIPSLASRNKESS